LYSCYNGYGILSVLFPNNFEYQGGKQKLKIHKGVIISGAITSDNVGNKHGSIIGDLHKYYSKEIASEFITQFQYYTNHIMLHRGFSVGLSDCVPSKEIKEKINDNVIKTYTSAYNITLTEKNKNLKEIKICDVLNNAKAIGDEIIKESIKNSKNRLLTMITAGSKGNNINVSQIQGSVSQQMYDGKRALEMPRTFPHIVKCDMINPFVNGERESYQEPIKSFEYLNSMFENPKKIKKSIELKVKAMTSTKEEYERELDKWKCTLKDREFKSNELYLKDKLFQSRGYVRSSYCDGLNPIEFFNHAKSGRLGVISTAISTQDNGYEERKMIKIGQDYKYDYNGTINNATHSILGFQFGKDNTDTRHQVLVDNELQFVNVSKIADILNNEIEDNNEKEEDIIK
jgi:DNA-directed RNA polymerase beta' subunit